MFEIVNEKTMQTARIDSNICLLCDKHDNNCSICNEGTFDFVHCDNKADK